MAKLKSTLEGTRVIDCSRFQAGPRCGLMLARLGAEVIHVEEPGGEEGRGNPPFVGKQSAYWVQYNSGKKSMTLNLRHPRAKEIMYPLVKTSDIFLQNFQPGVIAEMGFGYDVLRELNPRIIMVNVSAYGQYGPYKNRPGFDVVGQAMSGHMSLTGFPGSPPVRTYFSVIDRITALHATIGTLAALHERELSGEGQTIDVSLGDSGFTLTEIPIAAYLGAGIVPQKRGNKGGAVPLVDCFQTKDGWAVILAPTKNIFSRFAQVVGKTEWLEDPTYLNNADRRQHEEEIDKVAAHWFAQHTTKEAVDIMSEAQVPVAPVNDIPAAAKEPQLWERELLVKVPDPLAGEIYVSGKIIKFGRSENIIGSAPTVGQHNEEIICGLLGLPKQKLEQLKAEGAI